MVGSLQKRIGRSKGLSKDCYCQGRAGNRCERHRNVQSNGFERDKKRKKKEMEWTIKIHKNEKK